MSLIVPLRQVLQRAGPHAGMVELERRRGLFEALDVGLDLGFVSFIRLAGHEENAHSGEGDDDSDYDHHFDEGEAGADTPLPLRFVSDFHGVLLQPNRWEGQTHYWLAPIKDS
jgi:hypothetical protein